jgi:endonuclease YncB( thermonuclease family)
VLRAFMTRRIAARAMNTGAVAGPAASLIPSRWRTALALLIALGSPLFGTVAAAESFDAAVTHVSDGDTVYVRLPRGGPSQAVRVLGIDAPEICQSHGAQARDALADRIAQRVVRIHAEGHDGFGRTLGRISMRGEDIGGWMVREGHAWSYRFHRSPGPYVREERLARLSHRGLWRDARPVEPRDFRKLHGPCGEQRQVGAR